MSCGCCTSQKALWGESEDGLFRCREGTKLRARAPDNILRHRAPISHAQRTKQRQKVVLKKPPNWGFDPFDPIPAPPKGFPKKSTMHIGGPISELLSAPLLDQVRLQLVVIKPRTKA